MRYARPLILSVMIVAQWASCQGLQTEAINNFAGGVNDTISASILRNDISPDCQNVFRGFSGTIEKVEGWAYADTVFLSGDDDRASAGDGVIKAMTFTKGTTEWMIFAGKFYVKSSTNSSGPVRYVGHSSGTVSVTANSATITGTNTSWTFANIKAEDIVVLSTENITGDDTSFYRVATVSNDTSIILQSSPAINTMAGLKYTIAPRQTTSNSRLGMEFYNGELVVSDGVNTPWTWDTVRISSAGAMPKSTELIAHKNKLFTGGTSSNKTRVQWCNTLDIQQWTATDYQDFGSGESPGILGFSRIYDALFVLLQRRAYTFTGDLFDSEAPDFSPAEYLKPNDFFVPTNVGKTIIQVGNRLRFLGKHDIYEADARRIESASVYRYDTALGRVNQDAGISDNTPYTAAGVWGDHTFFAFRDAAGANKGVRIDQNGSFWPVTSSATAYLQFAGKFYRTIGDNLYVLASSRTDDGTNGFSAYWESKQMDQGLPSASKHYEYALISTLASGSSNYVYGFDVDGGGVTFTTSSIALSGSNTIQTTRVNIGRPGRNIVHRFENSTAQRNFRPREILLFYRTLEPISGR